MQVAIPRGVELPLRGRIPLGVKLRLGVEILSAYARVHLLLARSTLAETVTRIRDEENDRPFAPSDLYTAARLGFAVQRLLRVLPFDSRCLVRSLVLTLLLERRGIPSRLVIGVRPGDRFKAHAWVEAGSVPMLPARGANTTYERVAEL